MAKEKRSDRAGIGRREALRRVGQLLLAPIALLIAGKVEAAPRVSAPGVPVFRLRPCPSSGGVRRCSSCKACVNHATNKYFATPAAADRHRAHRHCNCVIVREVVPLGQFQQMFLPGTRQARVMFDRRW